MASPGWTYRTDQEHSDNSRTLTMWPSGTAW